MNYTPSANDEFMIKRYPHNSLFYEIRLNTLLNSDWEDNCQSHNDFVVVIFDINKPDSFIYAKEFFEKRLKKCINPHENGLSNIILIGNNTDLPPVSIEYIEQINLYCNEKKISFFQASVKENRGVNLTTQTWIEAFDNDVFKFILCK